MAGAGATATHSTKPQKLTVEQNQEDPSKFYYHFVYKAAIVLIFFVILPLFPSQAPEFINQSLLTRNWELLHLVFVGIAISYGLFSRRNHETDKENTSKFDTAQSLVSRFLQVSSFFEDEGENPSESDETKVQTWSNQHYRNEPVVVVAPQAQHPDFAEDQSSGEKPLLLPVRSLKSRLSDDADVVQSVGGAYTRSLSLDRSTSNKTGSRRFSSNSNRARNNAELEGAAGSPRVENVVLPSPIPWRSRSARMMEPKLEVDTSTQHSSKPSMEEPEFNKVEYSRPVKSQTSRSSSRTSSVSSSPKLTPPPSESLAKNAEDLVRKKSFYKSCPPPPPPPPPTLMFQKSISMKPRYGSFGEGASFDKELKRSFTGERSGRNWNRVESGIEVKPRGYAGQNLGSFSRGREIGKEGMNIASQVEEEEEERSMQEPITRKNMGYERTSFRSDKFTGHVSEPAASMEFARGEEKESFLDKVIVESGDEDTETEDEDGVGEGRIIEKESGESPLPPPSSSGSMGDEVEGPDVDKKADEFIAKFREQIRLQRIESIKRSTRIATNSSR